MISRNNATFFTKALMLWNKEYNDRSMPWKGEKDPYKIWLSEIILQQTRVEQGWDYYNRFVQKFPKIKDLANAKDDTVFKMWEGLGYYSRCRNLIATARFIQHELAGKFPDTFDEILALKGIGNYTASAIASFAFDLPFAVVDGNVNRVLSRFFGIETPTDTSNGKIEFAELAQQLLPQKSPGLYNQAIMDFGATICKPQLPLCETCPMRKRCVAFATNQQGNLPVKEKKLVKKNRWFYYLVFSNSENVLVRQRTTKDIWQNLHEFYKIETASSLNEEELLAELKLHKHKPKGKNALYALKEYKQQLTHQTLHVKFIELPIPSEVPPSMFAVKAGQLKKLAFPRLINSYLEDKGWK